MKYFPALILCLVASASTLPVQDDLDETKELAANNETCIERTGLSLEQIEELRTNPKAETPKPGMCYIKCIAELSGLETDGFIQKDAAVNYRPEGITKEDAEKLIEECSKLDADDPCEKSFVRYMCVFERSERKAWLKTE